MKKILFLIFFFLFFLISPLSAQTISGEKIQSFAAQIKINKGGTINVSEKIVYDFDGLEKHGIYRIIPYIKKNKEGKLFQLDFKDISVRDENERPYRYTISKTNDNLKIKIGDPDRTITGVHTYIINYQVFGALTYFSDHDELYWNVTGNEWPVPIEKANAIVNMSQGVNCYAEFVTVPEEDYLRKAKEGNCKIVCYSGPLGSRKHCAIQTPTATSFKVENLDLLSPYNGLTFAVSFPKNIVTVLEPKEVVAFFDTIVGKIVTAFFILLSTFWYLGLPIYIIYRWFKFGRDPKATIGVTTAWFDPPRLKGETNRFLAPGEVGALGDETVDLKDISATIVDLARRGYLKIEEQKKGDFYLVKENKQEEDKLLDFEKSLLQKFFQSKKTIRLKTTWDNILIMSDVLVVEHVHI